MGYQGKEERISQTFFALPTNQEPMKILLVDDHVLFREGLATLLDSQPDLTVTDTAETVAEAVNQTRLSQPDLILMNFNLPDGTGLDATRTILKEYPHMKIVFLTLNEDDERLFEAIRDGARGYLLKNVSVARLLSYVREEGIRERVLAQLMTKFSKN